MTGELSQRKAADIIGVSYASVRRHFINHMRKETIELSKALVDNLEETSLGSVMNAEQTLSLLIEKSIKLIEQAEKAEKPFLQLQAMDQTRKCLETAGKLFAELIKPSQDNTVKIETEFV